MFQLVLRRRQQRMNAQKILFCRAQDIRIGIDRLLELMDFAEHIRCIHSVDQNKGRRLVFTQPLGKPLLVFQQYRILRNEGFGTVFKYKTRSKNAD